MENGDSHTQPFAITVGRYSEGAFSRILLGSEHANGKPINVTFSQFRNMQQIAKNRHIPIEGSFSRGPVTIGNGVVISQNTIIRSGVTIHNGAVIGASAVVTKDVPAYAIVAGSPAKLIRYRFDEATRESLERIRWWDLKPSRLIDIHFSLQHLHEMPHLEAQMALKPSDYRKHNGCYWVFSRDATNQNHPSCSFLGAEIRGKFHPADKLTPVLRHYIDQGQQPAGSVIYGADDIFEIAGYK